MNRIVRAMLASLVAMSVLLAPTAAGAGDENVAVAVNATNGGAIVVASVQYRVEADGVVEPVNRAEARARCTDCQTVAAAFQLVLVTNGYETLTPRNRAFALNVVCAECLTWASAKQVIVATNGPATLTGNGHIRLRALEDRLEALESDLPSMTLQELQGELDGAYRELLDIAATEVRRIDGAPEDAEVVATRTS